jgi:hypothetical protein
MRWLAQTTRAQGLRRHEEFHCLGVPYLRHGTRRGPKRGRRDALPRGVCGHNDLRWVPPIGDAPRV